MINMILNGLEPPDAVRDFIETLVIASAAISLLVVFAASVFAVYLGWRLALADDEQKRKSVKGQIMWSILAIVVVVAIVGIWSAIEGFLTGGEDLAGGTEATDERGNRNPVLLILYWLGTGEGVGGMWLAYTMLGIIAGMGGLLAIYLGVKLATADNEQARSNAKAQLVYAILAVVIVAGLLTVFSVIDFSGLGRQPADTP